jgi:peptidoglycan hydrolase-like protein with peptidoglycan-binding domain
MRTRYRRLISGAIALALALALAMPAVPHALAATRYSTLAFGSRGTDVLKLQKALQTLGLDPGGTDGKFGRGTENAVIQYQVSKGLTADGKAGTATLTALYAEATATAETSNSGNQTTATASNSNTLQYGDSGTRVSELQTALTKLGYDTGGVDGRFGAGTRKAVIAFQKASGLTADGLAGTKTQNLLATKASASEAGTGSTGSTGSSTDGSFTRTLRRGYTGNDVLAVQKQLKALGYYTSTLDGVYGAGTMAAVSAFQKNNKLSVDGLVGSKTYAKMFSTGAVSSGSTDSGTDTSTDSGSPDSGAYTSLSLGATGTAVKNMQKALKDLGYSVSVDGNFGAQTKIAVTAFQKLNNLTADGVAGAITQQVLYSGSAVKYDSSADTNVIITDDTGKASGPSTSAVKCLYWFTEVKPNIKSGQNITIFDPATDLQWTLRLYSLGHHADSEPLTATDTAIMYKAFGYTNTWTPKPVYVKLPSGTWTLATMHNVPHLNGSIKNNNFDGHLCVHFLRTLAECAANDPDYGITNQNAIRRRWKAMTGIDIAD